MRPALPFLTLVAWVLAGCGAAEGVDPVSDPKVTPADAQVRLVEEEGADLVLFVSNQSFEDEEVRMTVAVDGVAIVDDDFHVEGQHTWIKFPLGISPGVHEVTAESDSGATISETFQVPGNATRFAVLEYWGKGDPAFLSWSFHRQPIAFD